MCVLTQNTSDICHFLKFIHKNSQNIVSSKYHFLCILLSIYDTCSDLLKELLSVCLPKDTGFLRLALIGSFFDMIEMA